MLPVLEISVYRTVFTELFAQVHQFSTQNFVGCFYEVESQLSLTWKIFVGMVCKSRGLAHAKTMTIVFFLTECSFLRKNVHEALGCSKTWGSFCFFFQKTFKTFAGADASPLDVGASAR